MDFGAVSLEGLVGGSSDTKPASFGSLAASLDPEAKHKWYGSGFKQERSGGGGSEDDWRSSKLLKSSTSSASSSLPPPNGGGSNNSLSFFTRGEAAREPQMLSFSCPKPEAFPVADRSTTTTTQSPTLFPFFHLSSSDYYGRSNAGYASGGLNSGGGTHLGVFTQSQWIELEQQALIYKYITANVPIPSNLLLPIRKAVESARLSFFPSSFLRPNALGWGAFHLAYGASSDPEPGRCRRTDGKKWRCSRDAVADQKYCERHMNRGRHRSRKPVEGQSGHSAAASATTPKNAKLANSSSSQATMVVGPQGSSATNCLPIHFQPASSSSLSQASSLNRTFLEKENLVTAESFLSSSRNSSSLTSSGNFGSVDELAGRGTVLQHPVRQFMDDWTSKNQSDCSAVSWPQLDLQSDTHLSISIPMATADYMSSTSSPAHNERPLSPLRLSRDIDPIQMGLGVSSITNVTNQKQASWIPISWGTSMGGPLGEVLNNTSSNNSGECRNSSPLNLMTEGWDTSPRMDSSPTGVLQKTTFPSLSNSSAGSSPRADNTRTSENASLCNDRILVNPSLTPSAF